MKNVLFDFENTAIAEKSLKKIAQAFSRAGQNVVETALDAKVRRSSGVTYREALLTFASGQTVMLRIKNTGDVYQVLMNGTMLALKNQDEHLKAVAEIANALEKNQPKFQQVNARKKVALPAAIKTAAPRIEQAVKAQVENLDTQIADATAKRDALKAELGDEAAMDDAALDAAFFDSVESDFHKYYENDYKNPKYEVSIKGDQVTVTFGDLKNVYRRIKLEGRGSPTFDCQQQDFVGETGKPLAKKGVLDNAMLDAAKPKFQIGDDLHNKKINRIGNFRSQSGDTVKVRTVKGLEDWDIADVEKVESDDAFDDTQADLKTERAQLKEICARDAERKPIEYREPVMDGADGFSEQAKDYGYKALSGFANKYAKTIKLKSGDSYLANITGVKKNGNIEFIATYTFNSQDRGGLPSQEAGRFGDVMSAAKAIEKEIGERVKKSEDHVLDSAQEPVMDAAKTGIKALKKENKDVYEELTMLLVRMLHSRFDGDTSDYKKQKSEIDKLIKLHNLDSDEVYFMYGDPDDPKDNVKKKLGITDSVDATIDDASTEEPVMDAAKPSSQDEAVKMLAQHAGLRVQALDEFVTENGLDVIQMVMDVSSKKLDAMDLMTCIAGNPGNKIQKKVIAKYKTGALDSTEEPEVGEQVLDEALQIEPGTIIKIEGIPFEATAETVVDGLPENLELAKQLDAEAQAGDVALDGAVMDGAVLSANAIEYVKRDLFKGKKLSVAAKSFVQKFGGDEKATFIGDTRGLTPEIVENAVIADIASDAVKFATKAPLRPQMALNAVAADSKKFNIPEDVLAKAMVDIAPELKDALSEKFQNLDSTDIRDDSHAHGNESSLDAAQVAVVCDAVKLAETYTDCTSFDSANIASAKEILVQALNAVETNYPINVEAGNAEQAALELANAAEFRNAIGILEKSCSAAEQNDAYAAEFYAERLRIKELCRIAGVKDPEKTFATQEEIAALLKTIENRIAVMAPDSSPSHAEVLAASKELHHILKRMCGSDALNTQLDAAEASGVKSITAGSRDGKYDVVYADGFKSSVSRTEAMSLSKKYDVEIDNARAAMDGVQDIVEEEALDAVHPEKYERTWRPEPCTNSQA